MTAEMITAFYFQESAMQCACALHSSSSGAAYGLRNSSENGNTIADISDGEAIAGSCAVLHINYRVSCLFPPNMLTPSLQTLQGMQNQVRESPLNTLIQKHNQ